MKSAILKSTGIVFGAVFCASIACAATPAAERKSETDLVAAAFQAMDTNGDAQISREEFNAFMASRLANQRASIEQAFENLDTNGDGGIDKAEAASNAALEKNFADVDANHDGTISRNELVDAARAAQMADTKE